MNGHTWRVIAVAATLGVALAGPAWAADPQEKRPYIGPRPPDPSGQEKRPYFGPVPSLQRVVKPDLSCSTWFSTDEAGQKKVEWVNIQDAYVVFLVVEVKNNGPGNAKGFYVQGSVGVLTQKTEKKDGFLGAKTSVFNISKYENIPPLDKGKTIKTKYQIKTWPWGPQVVGGPGYMTIDLGGWGTVDSTKQVDETNENNNVCNATIKMFYPG